MFDSCADRKPQRFFGGHRRQASSAADESELQGGILAQPHHPALRPPPLPFGASRW